MSHVGMADEQTQGVKLGISKIANYNSRWINFSKQSKVIPFDLYGQI